MWTRRPDGVELWWDRVTGREVATGRRPGADTGGGAPVMLVPGRGDSTDIFPPDLVEPLVASGLSVVRFDPRDAGLSRDGGHEYTMATMADDALAILDEAAGPDTAAHWVGFSMGGLQLVDLATRHADRIASLTLVSAMSPDPDADFGPDFFAPPDGDPVAGWIRAMGEADAGDREWAAAQIARSEERAPARPDAAERHMAAAMRFGWPTVEDLQAIVAPTVVVHGTSDRVLPVAHAEAFARGIGAAALVLREGMGHHPRPTDWAAIAAAVV